MKHCLLSAIAITTFFLCFGEDKFDDHYHRNGNLENPQYCPDDYSSQASLAFRIDTPEDKARERIHNQCDELSAHARFSCPTYSAKDIQISMCSSWSVTDFARAVEHAIYQAMQQGKSRSNVEQELLREYEFYSLPAFRDYLKTLPTYRPHIKKLRDRLVAQKGKGYRLLRALGFLNPEYVRKLDLAEELYAEILEEEQQEHRLEQQKLYQKAIQAQQALQRKQEATRTIFDQQREHLQQLSDEWLQVQDMYQDFDLGDDGRYERRQQAIHDMSNNGGCIYETKSYRISPETAQFIRNMGTDDTVYQACYGNQLQQVIHQEYIDGLNRLAALPESSIIHPYQESIAYCFDAAREYNQAGTVDKATMITDFCWSLLDYGKAIAEGAALGMVGAVQDTLENPGQALLCALAGECVLAYQVSKVLYNVADIGITYTFDAKRGKQKWDDYVAPVAQLIDAINNKELSLRDGIKSATQFAVQWKAQGKLLKGMNKFCTIAKTKALEFAKNNPLAVPEQYMATPEGILLQSTHNTQPLQSKSITEKPFNKRVYRRMLHTNEQCRIIAPANELKAWEWAEEEYEKIRTLTDDIEKIASNTKKSKSFIARVKQHVFHDESHILHERIGRLDADPEIASAWYRLYDGDFITNDIKLLEHEYFESKLEKLYKLTLRQAHNATQSTKGKPWYEPKYEEIK